MTAANETPQATEPQEPQSQEPQQASADEANVSPESVMSEFDIEALFRSSPIDEANRQESVEVPRSTEQPQQESREAQPEGQQLPFEAPSLESLTGFSGQQAPQPAQPQTPQTPQQPQQPQTPQQPETPATPLPTPQQTNEALQLQLAQQAAQIAELQRMLQQQQAPAEQTAAQPGELPSSLRPQQGQYTFSIPQQVIEGIQSEDHNTAAATLQYVLDSVLQQVDHSIMARVNSYIGEAVQNGIQESSARQQQAQQIREDFFSAFPQYRDRPELLPVIQHTTRQVMSELGTSQWSEPVRNMVGARLVASFPHLGQGAPGAPPVQSPGGYAPAQPQYAPVGQPVPQPPAQFQQPARQFEQGVRAGNPNPVGYSEQRDINEIVFGVAGGGF
jgi:hypothetical protein